MIKIKRNKGFTLIEVLIVLGIAAIVAAAAYFTYNSVRLTNQINEETRNLEILRTGIQNIYANVGTDKYLSLHDGMVAKSGFVPSTMVTSSGTKLKNIWSNEYTISGVTNSSTRVGYFTINFDIPKNACEKFLQNLFSWDLVRVNNMTIQNLRGGQNFDSTMIFYGCALATTDNVYITIGSY